ncbi:hypothetical protein [Chitinophaga sp. sic0106]|uniref:hypothetical protein n=1 Tax=Chitinophaga sp. sic0106 TaxID=2854785 RepID=UPI001C47097A|nr:hypothetical protein [Chitinophaga sp. sic0106]MBV7534078.1 hypothetical protein [Chitinophaga sp. sic0106]
MTNNLRGHQGDVQFASIQSIPSSAKRVLNKPIALGEHSGHMHVITGDVEMLEAEGRIICVVGPDGARIQHVHESNFSEKDYESSKELPQADHGSHLLPEGTYEFYIQNSYNPYSKLMERVID